MPWLTYFFIILRGLRLATIWSSCRPILVHLDRISRYQKGFDGLRHLLHLGGREAICLSLRRVPISLTSATRISTLSNSSNLISSFSDLSSTFWNPFFFLWFTSSHFEIGYKQFLLPYRDVGKIGVPLATTVTFSGKPAKVKFSRSKSKPKPSCSMMAFEVFIMNGWTGELRHEG